MPAPKLYSSPSGSVPRNDREDVVLLLVQRIDVVDQADAAVELHARRQPAPVVVVERRRRSRTRTLVLVGSPSIAFSKIGFRSISSRPKSFSTIGLELELELAAVELRCLVPFELEVPAEIDRQLALLEEAAADAELRAGIAERLAVRVGEVDVGRRLDLVGQTVGELERGPVHEIARQGAARESGVSLGVTLGHVAVERLELDHAPADGLVRIDFELERIDLGLRAARQENAGEREQHR